MWLLVGDLHLTDHARDSYRFGVFDWIAKQQDKRPTAATFLAGDITDAKDRHSATLVNKIVKGLLKLRPPVYVVMGNHDYRDPKNPFFKFLNYIDGITFVVKPTVIKAGLPIGLIPHYREQDLFEAAVDLCSNANSLLVHQTFEGAIAESGVRLSGLSASPVESLKLPLGVYAGDVHRPQTQGCVTYLGCPYQVRFGDNFEPRCLWVDQDKYSTPRNVYFEAPHKWSLTVRGPEDVLANDNLLEGDQVKLTIELPREEAVDWKTVKRDVLAACKKLKLEVYGAELEIKTNRRHTRLKLEEKHVSPADVLAQFCKAENTSSQIRKIGMEILNEHE
jgi:DNA repair exonuclease SbcCD nuclease subunit